MDDVFREILERLPGFNCGACGHDRCDEFAEALIEGRAAIEDCPYLKSERFKDVAEEIRELLEKAEIEAVERPVGIIDGLEADFVLSPLPGEPSCREDIHPLTGTTNVEEGEIVRYRPLGCPITHFAEVLKADGGLLTVHIVGPLHRIEGEGEYEDFKDVGLCFVVAFEGIVEEGRVPDVGETVRFIPEGCMMGKVHTGVVVEAVGNKVRIEYIDLKVWEHATGRKVA